MSEIFAEDDPVWTEACRREEVIRGLLRSCPDRLTISAVEHAALEMGLSRATTYRLIRRYRAARTVDVLLDRPLGRPKGTLHEQPTRDAVINEFLEREYLKPTRPPLRRVVAHIAIACRQQGLPAPTWRTVKARLLLIDERTRASRRGETDLIRSQKATPGEYEVSRPLQVVQIDHTQVDVIVVEEGSRESAGRPWITLAVDVTTRMVTGFHLALEAPSRTSIGLCLLHTVYDKTAWLAERNIDAPWPIAGLPEALHADNGADFRSRAFDRACQNYGIKIKWRPVGEPHFGGHIERLIGTTMGAVHMLPGSTFSNPADRGSYQSAAAARMTLRELERWIAWEITGNYHQRVHAALNRPPIAVWREQEDKVKLRLPVDRLQFWVSFLPEEERSLRRDGIHFCNIRYWSDALAADVGHGKEKLLIKYDPRDLSRIFVRRSSGRFVEARYRDLGWPPITLAEQRAVMRMLRAQGRHEVDEDLLFKTALRQREIVDAARRQTVSTRKNRELRPVQAVPDSKGGTLKGIDSRIPSGNERVLEDKRER
jgi:putative transposase